MDFLSVITKEIFTSSLICNLCSSLILCLTVSIVLYIFSPIIGILIKKDILFEKMMNLDITTSIASIFIISLSISLIIMICSIPFVNKDIEKIESEKTIIRVEVDSIDIDLLPKELIINHKKERITSNKDTLFYDEKIEQPYYMIEEEKVIFNKDKLSNMTKNLRLIGDKDYIAKYTIKEIHY